MKLPGRFATGTGFPGLKSIPFSIRGSRYVVSGCCLLTLCDALHAGVGSFAFQALAAHATAEPSQLFAWLTTGAVAARAPAAARLIRNVSQSEQRNPECP